MTKLLERPIRKVKELPVERQDYAAYVLETIAAKVNGVYHLTDEERADVQEALEEVRRGEVVSEKEMEKFWSRHQA